MKYIVIFTLLVPLSAFSQNKRLYVNSAAAGANTGTNWADAFTGLNAALAQAQWGDTVWVAAGQYRPAAGNDRDSSFRPASGVRLYGGFAGNENSLEQRDWNANLTVLSGDIGLPDDSTDNSYTIMYLDQPDSTTVVDGFVFRHGMATTTLGEAVTSPRRSGGALYIMGADGEAYAIVRHCRFERNRARSHGGAVYVNGTQNGSVAPQFLDCIFVDNSAGSDGGAVHRNGSSWAERVPDFGHCIFERNQAGRHGGGLFFQDAERTDTMQLDHCDFLNNSAGNLGGGSMLFASRGAGGNVSISNCSYKENQAEDGAAFALWPSGFLTINHVSIDNCVFEKNSSSKYIVSITALPKSKTSLCEITRANMFERNLSGVLGSGFVIEMLKEGNLVVSESRFISNKKDYIIHISEFSKATMNNCIFGLNTGNKIVYATSNIDTIIFDNLLLHDNLINSQFSSGTIFIRYSSQFTGTNFAFVGKNLFYVDMPDIEGLESQPIIINNSILSKVQMLASKDGNKSRLKINLSHSALYNTGFTCADLPPGACGPGMIEGVDPMFMNPDSGDFRLHPCSPLVDAGENNLVSADNTADLAGNPRITGGRVDMGAYENPLPNLANEPAVSPACPGTNSGSVALQPENGCPPYDYAWVSAGSSGSGLSGLPAGTYTLTVTDARGASFSVTFTIPEGNDNELDMQAAALVCGDTTGGSARAVPLNAEAPYVYQWSNGGADSLLTGLAAGYYLVTVTDALGCTAAGMVEVSQSGSLDVQLTVDPVSCPGAADGSLTVLPTNGKAPFTWVWENGPSGPTYAPLGPGTYLGTVTDALGCRISWILPLSDPPPIVFQVVALPASGPAAPDGAAVLDGLTGGVPPLDIAWSNGANGIAADSLTPGQYSVTVSDAGGCQKIVSFEVPFSVGTGAADMQEYVRLSPNPARARVSVQTGTAEPMRVRAYDTMGRLQLETAAGAFDVSRWPAGAYWVQVWTKGRPVAWRKLAVLR